MPSGRDDDDDWEAKHGASADTDAADATIDTDPADDATTQTEETNLFAANQYGVPTGLVRVGTGILLDRRVVDGAATAAAISGGDPDSGIGADGGHGNGQCNPQGSDGDAAASSGSNSTSDYQSQTAAAATPATEDDILRSHLDEAMTATVQAAGHGLASNAAFPRVVAGELVQEGEEVIGTATVSDAKQDEKRSKRTLFICSALCICASIAVAVLVVTIGVFDPSSSSSAQSSSSSGSGSGGEIENDTATTAPPTARANAFETSDIPTVSPSASPTQQPKTLFDVLYDVSGDPILVDGSPQHAAYKWISEHENGMPNGTDPNQSWSLLTEEARIIKERYAAAVFYYALEGPSWSHQLNFLSPTHVCDWFDAAIDTNSADGIMCDPEGLLTQIHIGDDIVPNGNIPDELGQLTSLTRLSLAPSKLGGTLPDTLENLQQMKVFRITTNNDLEGTIPSAVGNWPNLEEFHIARSLFTGDVPLFSGNQGHLKELHLPVRDKADLFGDLAAILNSISSEKIEKIHFDNVKLTGTIPPDPWSRFTNLRFLHIGGGGRLFGSIPTEIGMMTALEDLLLNGNELVGTVPSEIGNAMGMKRLLLNNNNLYGQLPHEIGQFSNLEIISIHTNKFTGTFPQLAENLDNLVEVNLAITNDRNFFYFDLASFSDRSPTTNLEYIRCAFCQMNGTLPDSLGDNTKLMMLNLNSKGSDVQLTGSIPSSFAKLTKLEHFKVRQTKITGTIPTFIGTMKKLKSLLLHVNNLSGTIPTEVASLPKLQEVSFQYNPLLVGDLNVMFCDAGRPSRLTELWADCDFVACDCCDSCPSRRN